MSLHRTGDQVVLLVADDGVGMPELVDPEESRSMGLKIVTTLTAQLDGRLELFRNPGTTFRIAFPAGPQPQAQNGSGPHAA